MIIQSLMLKRNGLVGKPQHRVLSNLIELFRARKGKIHNPQQATRIDAMIARNADELERLSARDPQ